MIRETFIKLSKKLCLTLLVSGWVSCSSEGDPELPGECELQCSGAKISASDNVRFRALSAPTTLTCVGDLADGATGDASGPITVEMIVERPRALRYKSPFDDTAVEETDSAQWQSISGIIFEPVITGLMAGSKTNPENATIEGTVVSPFKYAGIVTPKSEWCTDSCGVARVELWPTCVGGASVPLSVQFHSGGLYSESVGFSVSHQ